MSSVYQLLNGESELAKAVATKRKPKAAKVAAPTEIIAYKAFDKDLSCLGFQYEIGKTYEHKGRLVMCGSGFHSCVEPLDVLNYYDITSSRFATVKAGGAITRKDDGDSKICSASVEIIAELKLPDFICAAVDATLAICKSSKVKGSVTSGHSAKNASSGHSAKNASSGDSAKNASSGHSAKNASSGDYATNASSGRSATNASSGDYATNASSGHSAKNASSGHSATNASSGHSAKNASSGHSAKNASSGDSATNEATGGQSVIAAAGLYSTAKGAKGTAIALPYKDSKDQIRFVCGVAGEKGCPADTWLIAKAGKLVKA
jgi:hypothetical protein